MPSFAQRVETQANLYFLEILPRHIDRDFRGAGYQFIAELMAAHDDGDPARILRVRPALPSKKAIAMAAGARQLCPLQITRGDASWFGRFSWSTGHRHSALATYTEWDQRQIELDEMAFSLLPDDAVDVEILLTLAHEYIHHFESYFGLTEQPLRGREHAVANTHYTPAQGRHRDTLFLAKKVSKWALLGVFGIGLTTAILSPAWMRPSSVPPKVSMEPAIKRPPSPGGEEMKALLTQALDRGEPDLRKALPVPPFLDSEDPPRPGVFGDVPRWEVVLDGQPASRYLCWMPGFPPEGLPNPVCVIWLGEQPVVQEIVPGRP